MGTFFFLFLFVLCFFLFPLISRLAIGMLSFFSNLPHIIDLSIALQNYNALSYDDKILDGFYDLYGVLAETTSEMPSLVDLQLIPVSSSVSWEAVLVNRAADADLLKLEERALVMAVESRSVSMGFKGNDLVQKLAALVADYMGGPVGDPEQMLKAWRNLSNHLRASVGNMVLSLGQLRIGLARHRALLFKVSNPPFLFIMKPLSRLPYSFFRFEEFLRLISY